MAKLIQKVKSLLKKEEAPAKETQPAKVRPAKKKVKKKPTTQGIEDEFKKIKKVIEENGYYSTYVNSLFNKFGMQKRGVANIKEVNNYLEKEGLYTSPVLSLEIKWDAKVRIYKFPVAPLRHMFKTEQQMEDLFEKHKWFEKLNLVIEKGDRQFKPKETRDRLDFKARDAKGNLVVLELKHKDGDKRLIDQVFRYRSLLKTNFPGEKVRCIIITGKKCVHTARAIHGYSPKKQKKISWYQYEWDKNKESEIQFHPITIDFINKHLAPVETNTSDAEGLA